MWNTDRIFFRKKEKTPFGVKWIDLKYVSYLSCSAREALFDSHYLFIAVVPIMWDWDPLVGHDPVFVR